MHPLTFECFGIILGVLLECTYGQDIIFVNTDEQSSASVTTHATRSSIPEELLIRIKDAENATDFLTRFVKDPLTSVSGRRGVAGGAAASVATPANCQTEEQIVELKPPEDPSILLWPACVRVRRCGGCCTSKRLTCQAIETSLLNITVLQVRYNPEPPQGFESLGTRLFSLEQHDRCSCRCKEKPEHCTPSVHLYREQECRCTCPNPPTCTGTGRFWDTTDCQCKCRRVPQCSTGRHFNGLTCRCETFQSPLTSTTLNRSNSTVFN